MRLRRLDLTRYGKFTDFSIDFGEKRPGAPDMHIVYGLNEAGKSTSLSAYLDLLFGIEEKSRYDFLHPYNAMQIGACLEFDGSAHELKRIKKRAGSLLDAGDQPMSDVLLGAPLAGLTRESYRTMFSLDDQTLEAGGDAILQSKGDLGELLFSASAGLADVSGMLAAIGEEADHLYRKRARSTEIAELKQRLTELKARRDEIDTLASAHAGLVASLTSAEQAYDEAMRLKGTARARHDEIARILRARPLADDYQQLREERVGAEDFRMPPAEWSALLPDLMRDETRLQTQMSGIDQDQARLLAEIEAIDLDEAMLQRSDRIKLVAAGSARYSTAVDDLPKRRITLAEQDAALTAILAVLGQQGCERPDELLLSASTIGSLRDLIEALSGIDANLMKAERELAKAQDLVSRTVEEKEAMEAGVEPISDAAAAGLKAAMGRLRQNDHQARLRLSERSLPPLSRRYDEQRELLAPWFGDGRALRALRLPDQRQIEAWRTSAAAILKRRTDHGDRLRELTTRRREEATRLEALRVTVGAIDDHDALTIRADRDAAWDEHLQDLGKVSALAFAGKMQAADAVADARLARTQDLAELRSLTLSLSVAAEGIDRQTELLREAEAEFSVLETAVAAGLTVDIGTHDGASLDVRLAEMTRWMREREEALSTWQSLTETEDDIAEAKADAERDIAILIEAMLAAGLEADSASPLLLVQEAETALSTDAGLKLSRSAIDRTLRDREADLESRRREFHQAVAAKESWALRWAEALDATWFAHRAPGVGAVREILDTLGGLPAALREREDLKRRIDTMEADQRRFAEDVASLLADLGEPASSLPVLEIARRIDDRREKAERQQQLHQAKQAEYARLVETRRALDKDLALHQARKAELTQFFGVDDLIEASAALEKAAARARADKRIAELARQLLAEMRGTAVEAVVESLASIDLENIEREQAELGGRLDDLEERTRELFAERSRATDRLSAVGSDDAVARIEAERRLVFLEIEDKALRYLRLKTGTLVADEALRAYRDRHRSSMMKRASEAFRTITRGEYSGLAARPEKDREILMGLTRQGGSKLAGDLSKGTRFQLYLALRLAGYEEFAATRPSVPFVADDIMETFDEPRSGEVFRLFSQMAGIGQVIYFTHHRHLCDLARSTVPDVQIHEISA